MLKVLKPILPIVESDIIESIQGLEKISKKIDSHNISMQNPSIELSEDLITSPIIYFPWGLNQLQPDTKILFKKMQKYKQ